MKRVFPLIVLLITLSVLGILFIQMQWIKNAIQIKKDQYVERRKKSLEEIRDKSYELFLRKRMEATAVVLVDKALQRRVLDREFTAQHFTVGEMHDLIQETLRSNNIKQPFEFAVTNYFRYPVLASDSF